MNCIIIDDVPLAIEVIESYLEKIDGIHIVAKCTNPLAAIEVLTNQKVDLVFLDIQMPNLTGLELIETLDTIPQFIITTAYPQYALDGFKLNATDYLVKPIPFNRFLTAVSRAKELHKLKSNNSAIVNTQPERKFIFVKVEYENIKINIDSITYIEGLGEYLKIHTSLDAKPILTLMNFKDILSKLSRANFIRTHRSFVVNTHHIASLQKSKIIIGDKRIPISETYKKNVLVSLGL